MKPGTVLKNGATIVAATPDGEGHVVLALTKGNPYHPYVTWWVANRNLAAYWGQYFADFGEAVADYNDRCKAKAA